MAALKARIPRRRVGAKYRDVIQDLTALIQRDLSSAQARTRAIKDLARALRLVLRLLARLNRDLAEADED